MPGEFYIQFNLKPGGPRLNACWPLLFPTEAAAWFHINMTQVFLNKDKLPNRGRLVSCSVQRIKRKRRR